MTLLQLTHSETLCYILRQGAAVGYFYEYFKPPLLHNLHKHVQNKCPYNVLAEFETGPREVEQVGSFIINPASSQWSLYLLTRFYEPQSVD